MRRLFIPKSALVNQYNFVTQAALRTSSSLLGLRWFVIGGLLVLGTIGCGRQADAPVKSAPVSSLALLRQMVEAGDWGAAWTYSDSALIEAGSDPESLELIAKVAFHTDHKSVAADLLVEVSRSNGLKDPTRFQSALSGLLAAGRLFDGIELLREAVAVRPADDELRRLFFDLLIATEQHEEAAVHRQVLIRHRKIDNDLLFSAYRYEKRNEEVQSLTQMLERNPEDKRPLIGKAKRSFDAMRYRDASEALQQIVDAHPHFIAAQAMLGRVIFLTGNDPALQAWAKNVPPAMVDESDYWLTLGDWAMKQERANLAMNAYAVAARHGVDRLEPWNKLASLLAIHAPGTVEYPLIKSRAAALARLRQSYAEYDAQSQQSPQAVHQISHALLDLGRLWEAEAWVAFGTTFPSINESERKALVDLRKEVLTHLKSDTPRQLADRLPAWEWAQTMSPSVLIATLSGKAPPSTLESDVRKELAWPASPPVLPKLRDEADEHDLVFFGRTADDLAEPGILLHQTMGCGGGTIDFDLDGWPDLYLITAGGTPPHRDSASNAMFRNLDGKFKNVSVNCGAEDRGFGNGVAIGDVNEDGFDDLLVLNYGPNSLWINNGDGTFTDHSNDRLPSNSTWSTSAALADIDGDGITDIFITNYCTGLEPSFEECFAVHSKGPRSCSPNHFAAEKDTILRGTPKGTFVDAAETWKAFPEIPGRGLGIVAGSLDDRPGIDLLVSNDMTPNHYWTRRLPKSDGDSFGLEESASLLGLAMDGQSRSQASMGIATADFNRDGVADFYVTNFQNEYNTLYLSRAEGGWSDKTGQERLIDETLPLLGFGTQAIDVDNNGECEIVVTNGHVDHLADENGVSFYEQPPLLFQRGSDGRFESVGTKVDGLYFQSMHVGRALWTTDANRDGKVDMVITHQTEPVALILNQTESNYAYLGLRLVGTKDARNAIGSVVTVRSKAHEAVFRLTSGNGFQCCNERRIQVGLGDHDGAVEVSVRWLNGETETWPALKTRQEWLIIQGDAAVPL